MPCESRISRPSTADCRNLCRSCRWIRRGMRHNRRRGGTRFAGHTIWPPASLRYGAGGADGRDMGVGDDAGVCGTFDVVPNDDSSPPRPALVAGAEKVTATKRKNGISTIASATRQALFFSSVFLFHNCPIFCPRCFCREFGFRFEENVMSSPYRPESPCPGTCKTCSRFPARRSIPTPPLPPARGPRASRRLLGAFELGGLLFPPQPAPRSPRGNGIS